VPHSPSEAEPPSRRAQSEIGLGTIAMALVAFSMALFAYLN
jgi:hypothetical protein